MAALPIGPETTREVLNGWTDVLARELQRPGPDGDRRPPPRRSPWRSTSARVAGASAPGSPAGGLRLPHPPRGRRQSSPPDGSVDLQRSPRLRPANPRVLEPRRRPSPGRNLPPVAERMGRHLASPVKFSEMVERMYSDGARVFVECGPGGRPVAFGRLDSGRPARIWLGDASTPPAYPGLTRLLLHGLARLIAGGRCR